MEDGTEFLMD